MVDNINNTNAPLTPVAVTTPAVIRNPSQLINADGTVYFVGDANDGKGEELYKLGANGQPILIGEIDTSFNGSGIGMITPVKGIVYFVADDRNSKQGLYRVDPSTGAPTRLGDMIIFTGNTTGGISANIVNLGDDDYFLANRGDRGLWKAQRSSGALSKVTPNGLPANFSFTFDDISSATGNNRSVNNTVSAGGNLYFRGNGQVWKFDPITNNASSIEIPNRASYNPGEFHQVGDAIFFETNRSSPGQELYKIDTATGAATLVSDPQFASSNYAIDDNNFVNVNGTLHFTTNYGKEIWKLDATGKAVLAAMISGTGVTNEPSEFINVNGTLCFKFKDETNQTQIFKLQSDGTVTKVTNIAPNPTYGTTSVRNLTAIGTRLYFTANFTANDEQYGTELRELDITTGNLTTLELSPGLYASSPADSFLNSNIIDVNGTPYFVSSVKEQDQGSFQQKLFQLVPAGSVTPTTPVTPNPTTPTTPTTSPDPAVTSGTPTAVPTTNTPPTAVTPTNNNPTTTTPFTSSNLTTSAGDGQLNVNLDLTGSFASANYDPLGAKTTADTTYESDVAFRIGDTGQRKFLSDIATNKSSVERNNNSTTSRFDAGGLKFELVQSVSDSTQGGSRTGSSLSQVYQITNPTDREITFELVRYFDGDLGFDGSIQDSGGRIVRNGRDILFETDSGDNPAAPTTFVGITANGGTRLADNRYEIGQFSSLRSRILDGQALSNGIQGDTNRDLFIDTAPYDVTPAFRNVFTLAAGESTSYITETLFGTGVPTQIILPETITVAATDFTAIEDTKDPAVFTLTRTNGNLAKSLTVNYTLSGKAISGEDYTPITNTVTFAAGQTTATVSIDPLTDGKLEGSESVILTLESKPGYNLSDRGRQSRITIADDASTIVDLPPTVSIDNITRKEGNSGTTPATFNITLNKASEVEVTVDYATKEGTAKTGQDFYAAAKNTIVFAPGEVSKAVTIDIVGDRVDEADETFQVVLTEPTNATLSSESTATATIINDDPRTYALSI